MFNLGLYLSKTKVFLKLVLRSFVILAYIFLYLAFKPIQRSHIVGIFEILNNIYLAIIWEFFLMVLESRYKIVLQGRNMINRIQIQDFNIRTSTGANTICNINTNMYKFLSYNFQDFLKLLYCL